MAGMEHMARAFDFSLDAQDFKARLWEQLKACAPSPAIEPLEDDDLEWVSAAGMIDRAREDKPLR
ncbi:MAG: hypothetical protein IKK75_09025 [Clostridia bacterium]|nr:hypothetical protein [Clostridia bacterium]